MPVNSEIFRIYRHLFYGSPLNIDIAMYFAVFAAKEEIGILIFFKEREVSIYVNFP